MVLPTAEHVIRLRQEISGFLLDSAGSAYPTRAWLTSGPLQVYVRTYRHPHKGAMVDLANMHIEKEGKERGLSLILLRHLENEAKRYEYRAVRVENIGHPSIVRFLMNDDYKKEPSSFDEAGMPITLVKDLA